ncbi:Uncharacterized protein GBIM_00411, partial [Gryllus bimaculatus]
FEVLDLGVSSFQNCKIPSLRLDTQQKAPSAYGETCTGVIEKEFGAEGENPFRDLRIDDVSFLDDIDNRSQCINCKKSRKYFCYTCYVPVEALNGRIPQLKLPIKIDIIKHSREIDGKSTAAHAAVLAGNDVSVYTFPCVPDYKPSDKVVVVYPGKNAMTLAEYFSANRNKDDSGEPRAKRRNTGASDPIGEPPDSSNIASSEECVLRAVFIDSTWNQSRGMFKDPRLHSLPCVVLERRLSHFWRHQSGSPRWYLATIEAIHQFLFEFHNLTDSQPYSGQYDNLLFFFRYMYSKIHKLYDHDDLKAYKRPVE